MADETTGVNPVGLVTIQGLKEFRNAIKALDEKSPKALKAGFNKAAEVVAQEARRRAPKRSGKLAASIRVASNTTAAQVRGGGAQAPYFGFIDYGNKLHAGHAVGRKDSVPREYIPTGRILYPAFYAKREAVTVLLAEALGDAARGVGLGVISGNE